MSLLYARKQGETLIQICYLLYTLIDGQKATGNGSIPKLLKASAHYLCDTITFIITNALLTIYFQMP